jgi:hypothetical protein
MANILYRGSAVPSAYSTATAGGAGANRALTNLEIDQNFYALDNLKFDKAGGTISGATTINGNLTIGSSGSVTIAGDLTVNGTTTTVNSTTISVDDINIELGSVASPTNATANGGGITLKGASDKTFNWYSASAAWTSSEHLALAAGKSLYLLGSSSGTVTVVASAAAGTPTLTLPTTSGTFAITADIGNGTLTVQGNNGLTGSGTFTANQSGAATITLSHVDTSSVADLTSAINTFITAETYDTYGHVLTRTTGTVDFSVSSNYAFQNAAIATNSGYTWGTANTSTTQAADSSSDTLTFVNGGGINLYTNTVAGTDAILIEHSDTSSQASVDNTGNTFVQDITLDTYGHITAIGTATVSIGDGTLTLNTNGSGISGSASFTANQSGNTTFTVTSNATENADPSTLVYRTSTGLIKCVGLLTSGSIGMSGSGLQSIKTWDASNATPAPMAISPGFNVSHSGSTATGANLTLEAGSIGGGSATNATGGNLYVRAGSSGNGGTNRYGGAAFFDGGPATGGSGANVPGAAYFGVSSGNVYIGSSYYPTLMYGPTTIASQLFVSSGSAAAPSIVFNSDTSKDTGLYWGGDGYISFASNGAYAGQIRPGGDIYAARDLIAGANSSSLIVYARDYVAIGAGQSTSSLYMQSTNSGGSQVDRRMYSGGALIGFLNTSNGWGSYCDTDGSWVSTANITAQSDARIKTNIKRIDDALNKVCQLNGYTFDRTDIDIGRQTGVIAQEVEKVLPEAVSMSNDTLTVAYGNMVGILIEAIKELNAKVVDLQNQLANK